MDDVELCPLWWPKIIWDIHFHQYPKIWNPGGPYNMPPIVNHLLIALNTHTSSYMMSDMKIAKEVRKGAIHEMKAAIAKLEEEEKG